MPRGEALSIIVFFLDSVGACCWAPSVLVPNPRPPRVPRMPRTPPPKGSCPRTPEGRTGPPGPPACPPAGTGTWPPPPCCAPTEGWAPSLQASPRTPVCIGCSRPGGLLVPGPRAGPPWHRLPPGGAPGWLRRRAPARRRSATRTQAPHSGRQSPPAHRWGQQASGGLLVQVLEGPLVGVPPRRQNTAVGRGQLPPTRRAPVDAGERTGLVLVEEDDAAHRRAQLGLGFLHAG